MCGLPWRTCRCAIWYEHRLILGADQEVNDQDAAPADDPLQAHLRVVGHDMRAELQRMLDDVIFDGTGVEEQEEEDGEGEEGDEEEIAEGDGGDEADEMRKQSEDENEVIFIGSNPVHKHTQESSRLHILGSGGGTTPQSCGGL